MNDAGEHREDDRIYNSAVIILDESGGLGPSPHSTRFFVVAATILPQLIDLDRLTKRARNKLGKGKYIGGLKFNISMDSTKMFILKGPARMDRQIVRVAIEEDRAPMSLRADTDLLHQMVCEEVLREAARRTSAKKVQVITLKAKSYLDKDIGKGWQPPSGVLRRGTMQRPMPLGPCPPIEQGVRGQSRFSNNWILPHRSCAPSVEENAHPRRL